MVKALELSVKEKQLHRALVLLERFKEHGDDIRVNKTNKLLKKIHDNEFITAFSGHFSAGKSTMINTLIGEQILPSSPIPTSANLVKVHGAEEDFAKVYYHTERPLYFQAPYDFTTVKEFCKNGDVTEIEIGKRDSLLPHGVTVMDTPGVDSTDDAHRISTESALHLADLVFYVMDYNHVQSELNFMYTKNLLKHGVKLFLIINQIDKHNNAELSFPEFKQSAIDSFATWGVNPAGIYFTTLKELEHPENEFKAVKMLIDEAFENHDTWLETTIEAAFNRLIDEHKKWLNEEMKAEAEPFEEVISVYSETELADIFSKEQRLKGNKKKLAETVEKWEKNFVSERESLLKNAYLMPFETRALAEQFLISAQPNFKLGLFFSKKKTEEERKVRLDNFASSVRKQVESQIDWHLKQWASEKLAEYDLNSEELQLKAQNLEVVFDDELLTNTIKKGAGVNGEYVLNYCEEVADRIKKIARVKTNQFKETVILVLKMQVENEMSTIQAELNQTVKAANALRSLIELEKTYEEKATRITSPTGNERGLLQGLQADWEIAQQDVQFYTRESVQPAEMSPVIADEIKQPNTNSEAIIDIQEMIKKLERAISHLKEEKGFKRITAQLAEKASRLKERNYTVALFGAFSAGKSSFANALLGKGVLPVSPNPTTAAINRICPPTIENKHGTAMVHLKNENQMLADIAQSLSIFGYNCLSLDDAYNQIPNILAHLGDDSTEKIHLSFLAAFLGGFQSYKDQLGMSLTTNLEDFQGFVGNETQSCFVETIDLFYDCDFTRQGITLVDTPGADSINARHTGVAFDFIKNADAILFVTYYNHAFSKADREFLIQLGRVKDAFELDKMFFIVNAIDLASSKEEINEVLDYVHGELTQNGIRFPKIFGISSKLALNQESRMASNIDTFKQEFDHFLEHELTKIAVQSAEADYNRVLLLLDELIASASEDEDKKVQRKADLLASQETINSLLLEADPEKLSSRLSQEIKELLFYVKQRVFYRFSDFFKEAFNPAVLRNNNRAHLKKALEELLDSTGYDFAQELRATSLRIENFAKKLLFERFAIMEKELQSIKREITISQMDINFVDTPDFKLAFEETDRKPLEGTFKYFKNPKAFFEQNEKKIMGEALQKILVPIADQYLNDEQKKLQTYYQKMINHEFSKIVTNISSDIEEQYEAWLQALSDQGKLSEWIQIRSALGK
ncbi:dynamin family protein [Lederbergia citrea]|uniref:Dynamin family GTPase n=1 Tax=Lederbergia citrea TaxID=2833581 RepID=A0A942Z350_9BACI|nr:dynamin family protein [Lederbergia citrea]MBS4222149.1 dynamin family GTPase [Lederbergia citrea]